MIYQTSLATSPSRRVPSGSYTENAILWREHVENRFDVVDEHLRSISDRLFLILTILAPDDQDGPTLDDLLAKLATLVAEQRPILRRVDNTTGATLDILEGRKPRVRPEDDGEADAS